MANFVAVLKTNELPSGTKKTILAAGKRMMVANVDGKYFALDDACTHAGCSLGGEGFVDGETITCGCHGSQFDLASGAVLAPPAATPMQVHEVKVEGDNVMVAV